MASHETDADGADWDFCDPDSWVEIASQPSSSSLSSINDDIITTGLRVQHDPRTRRRRTLRSGAPSHLNISHRAHSTGGTSSQEEYEESESESDRVMSSSGEGLQLHGNVVQRPALQSSGSEDSGPVVSDDDDENRTAINFPINTEACFTPQPNAFSHPPSSGQMRNASAPVPGSYFPATRQPSRPTNRQSMPNQQDRQSHMPQNILSPSYNAAAQHDEALRSSLSTLLSCAAAARGLPKAETKRPQTSAVPPPRGNRVEPMSLRLVPESALPGTSSPRPFQEPVFQPTIRRPSTSTSAASSERLKENKRKAAGPGGRSSSRERRALKKARRSASNEDLFISPTLLTWVVSAGVVVFLSALSFTAGYNIGKEAGRLEAGGFAGDEQIRTCAREASRSGLGLKRSLARSAVQV